MTFSILAHLKSSTQIIIINHTCKPDSMHSAQLKGTTCSSNICRVPICCFDRLLRSYHSPSQPQSPCSYSDRQKVIAVNLLSLSPLQAQQNKTNPPPKFLTHSPKVNQSAT